MPVFTFPNSPLLFFSVNISAMVSSPTTPASQPLDSRTAQSGGPLPILTGGRNEGSTPPLLAPSLDSPPMCDRDPLSHISFFHFHLLGKVPYLAVIEAIMLEMLPNNFSTLSQREGTERGYQRADRLKPQSQTTSLSDHMDHSLV